MVIKHITCSCEEKPANYLIDIHKNITICNRIGILMALNVVDEEKYMYDTKTVMKCTFNTKKMGLMSNAQ